MPKIQNVSTPVRTSTASQTAAPKKPAASPAQAPVKQGWTAGVGAAASKPSRYPEVATDAKNFVAAYANGNKAMTQMEMVASSVETNKAADVLLKTLGTELASQYADRGQDAKGQKVLKDLDAFFKKIGGPKGYRMDPERGTMASLEDNGARMEKVTAQLKKLSTELGKVNAEPAGDYQQAYNRSAGGDLVKAQVDFALKFQQKYYDSGADDAVIQKAQTFFKALPKNVDSKIENRGGSLEPLERAGGAAHALNEFAAKL